MAEALESDPQIRQYEFEQALSAATPLPYVTIGLVAINVLMYLAMLISGVSPFEPTTDQVLPWGANFWPLTASGQYWRLVTACFLHFGLIHLVMNMYILLQVGIFTEKLFGNVRYLLLYLLAGVGGNIAGLYLHPMSIGAGASGAIFGVYGALLAFLLIERGVVPSASAISIAKSAAVFLIYNLVYGLAQPQTDMVAHVGGFVTGLFAGVFLARPLAPGRQHVRPVRALLVAAGATAIAFAAMMNLPKVSAEQGQWYRLSLLGPRITTTSKDAIVYAGTATRDDANRLGNATNSLGFFRKAGILVVLTKDKSGTSISIPVKGDDTTSGVSSKIGDEATLPPWRRVSFLAAIEMLGAQLAPAVNGPPLTIRLIGNKGDLKALVPINRGEIVVGVKDRISFTAPVTVVEATALGRSLSACGYLRNLGSLVLVSKTNGAPEISFYVTKNAANDRRFVASAEATVRTVAATLGGVPIHVRLIDQAQNTAKEITVQ